MPNYKEELNSKKKAVEYQIKRQQVLVYRKIKFKTDAWWRAYKKLDDLRRKLKVVESRIENLGKNYGGIQTITTTN